jgi:hypothetical protein
MVIFSPRRQNQSPGLRSEESATRRPDKAPSPVPYGGNMNDFWIVLAVIGVWFLLQAYILPKLGVST